MQVRVVAHDLVEAKKWSADVRNCLSKVDTWVHLQDSDIEKVSLNHVENLLSFDPPPCNESGYLRLKVNKYRIYAVSSHCSLLAISLAFSPPMISLPN